MHMMLCRVSRILTLNSHLHFPDVIINSPRVVDVKVIQTAINVFGSDGLRSRLDCREEYV